MSSCITRALTEKEYSGKVLPMKFETRQRFRHLISELNKKIAYIIIVGVIFSCIEVYFVTKLSFLIPIYAYLVFSSDLTSALSSVLVKDSFLYTNYALFLKNFVILVSFLPFVFISAHGYSAITIIFILNLVSIMVKINLFLYPLQRH